MKTEKKSIDQVIREAMMVGPLSQLEQHTYDEIKDFIAQKIQVAGIRMTRWRERSDTKFTPEEIMDLLFEDLTKRGDGK